jgi:hypothetical protein
MPESQHEAHSDHATGNASLSPKKPNSRGADLSFVRPFDHPLTRNLLTMNRLPLCLHNSHFLGLVRPSCVGNPHHPSHNPQPTAHNPARDADLSPVRHPEPFFTNNPLVMSSLSLCPQKREILGLVRHRSLPKSTPRLSHNPHPTSHIPPPAHATIEQPHFVSSPELYSYG